MPCDKPKALKNPFYYSDVDNSYIQNKAYKVFRGQGEILPFGHDENAVYILKNPNNSKVNLIIKDIIITNLSCTPMAANMIYYAEATGDFIESFNIVNGNTGDRSVKSIGLIYSGTNIKFKAGVTPLTFTVPSNGSYESSPKGSILISPGMQYTVEVIPVNYNQMGYGIVAFDWWEEAI